MSISEIIGAYAKGRAIAESDVQEVLKGGLDREDRSDAIIAAFLTAYFSQKTVHDKIVASIRSEHLRSIRLRRIVKEIGLEI